MCTCIFTKVSYTKIPLSPVSPELSRANAVANNCSMQTRSRAKNTKPVGVIIVGHIIIYITTFTTSNSFVANRGITAFSTLLPREPQPRSPPMIPKYLYTNHAPGFDASSQTIHLQCPKGSVKKDTIRLRSYTPKATSLFCVQTVYLTGPTPLVH